MACKCALILKCYPNIKWSALGAMATSTLSVESVPADRTDQEHLFSSVRVCQLTACVPVTSPEMCVTWTAAVTGTAVRRSPCLPTAPWPRSGEAVTLWPQYYDPLMDRELPLESTWWDTRISVGIYRLDRNYSCALLLSLCPCNRHSVSNSQIYIPSNVFKCSSVTVSEIQLVLQTCQGWVSARITTILCSGDGPSSQLQTDTGLRLMNEWSSFTLKIGYLLVDTRQDLCTCFIWKLQVQVFG